jgi:hypothetical protein
VVVVVVAEEEEEDGGREEEEMTLGPKIKNMNFAGTKSKKHEFCGD